ncbi:MAG: hypothetical protein MJZ86_10710 [Bacteroidales bacterium]|nr:hypothetical protein [Bacteroidales bacterium]
MEKNTVIIPWDQITISLRKIFAFINLCIILVFPLKTNSQTTISNDGSLYSITTPYEIARKKLIDQSGEKLSKITSFQNVVNTIVWTAVSHAKDIDLEAQGTEIYQLEVREAYIETFIGISQLELFDGGSFEYLYNQVIKQLGETDDSPKVRFAKWYIKERKSIEKLKTARDNQRNLLRHPPAGSIIKLKKTVSYKFRNWIKKGEFESTADYHARLEKHATEVFDSICQSVSVAICHDDLAMRVDNYNADNEQLTLILRHGRYDSISTTQPISAAQARELVPRIRKGDSYPEASDVRSIGIYNGYLYPSFAPLNMGYNSNPFMLDIKIPLFTISYNELNFSDTLINRYMNSHAYLGQSAEELRTQRENNSPHFQQWRKYFNTREEYREYVKDYGTGKEFEKKTLFYKQYSAKFHTRFLSNNLFTIAYDRGGLPEVDRLLQLMDTAVGYGYGEYDLENLYDLESLYEGSSIAEVDSLVQLMNTARQYGMNWSDFKIRYQHGGLPAVKEAIQLRKSNFQQSQVQNRQDQQQRQEQEQARQKKKQEVKHTSNKIIDACLIVGSISIIIYGCLKPFSSVLTGDR